MSTILSNEDALKESLRLGVNKLADFVSSTLGPKGRNGLIKEEKRRPFITKDGVTVAKHFKIDDDPVANVAATIIKEASAQTNADAGDGTTTSTVLTQAIFNTAQGHIEAGASPVEIQRGLNKALEFCCEKLEELAIQVTDEEQIANIATISANNDRTIGELISLAVDRVGRGGSITIQEAKSLETSLDLEEGFKFDSGFLSNSFVTDERRGIVRYDNPIFLLTDSILETIDQVLPALEVAARENRPLVIVADDIKGQALAALIMNTARGTMKVAGVKAPRYGEERIEIMKDLALSVGAKYFQKINADKLSNVKLNDFGSAKTIEISKFLTTIVGGTSDLEEVQSRIDHLNEEIKDCSDDRTAQRMQERVTRLSSGVVIIRVGAATEIEMIEKKHRIEDALEAVKAAIAEGTVTGGGLTLIGISSQLAATDLCEGNDDQEIGVEILSHALTVPFKTMCNNSSVPEEMGIRLVPEENIGYNFLTDDICNLRNVGIIDPVKVTKSALQNAVSVAGTLITTNNAIVHD